MSMNKEKRSSTGMDGLHESPTSAADGAASEHPPEENTASNSGSQSQTTADRATEEQSPERGTTSDSTSSLSDQIADDSANQQASEKPNAEGSTKNPAAVSLGRLGGLKGGKARAKSLTKRERSEAARKAARARWRKKKPSR